MRAYISVLLVFVVAVSGGVIGTVSYKLIQADYERSKQHVRIIECLYAIDQSACAEILTRRR